MIQLYLNYDWMSYSLGELIQIKHIHELKDVHKYKKNNQNTIHHYFLRSGALWSG